MTTSVAAEINTNTARQNGASLASTKRRNLQPILPKQIHAEQQAVPFESPRHKHLITRRRTISEIGDLSFNDSAEGDQDYRMRMQVDEEQNVHTRLSSTVPSLVSSNLTLATISSQSLQSQVPAEKFASISAQQKRPSDDGQDEQQDVDMDDVVSVQSQSPDGLVPQSQNSSPGSSQQNEDDNVQELLLVKPKRQYRQRKKANSVSSAMSRVSSVAELVQDGGGEGGATGKQRELNVQIPCGTCGKLYKNQICLQKHQWEHHESWNYTKALMVNKHQCVMILEAAQSLMTMTTEDPVALMQRPQFHGGVRGRRHSSATLTRRIAEQEDEDEEDDQDEEGEQEDEDARRRAYPKRATARKNVNKNKSRGGDDDEDSDSFSDE